MDPQSRAVIPGTARAMVWHGGSDVRLEQVPIPALRPREMLVAVDVAAVCGSDLHTVSGARPAPSPSILGHEAVGTVVQVAHPVVADRPGVGDRVVWGVTSACGTCRRCRHDLSAKCERLLKTGHEPIGSAWGVLSGDYATHIVLPPGVPVVPVPAHVPDPVAAIAACALATVMACVEAAGSVHGQRVLITGAGMLGICAAAVSRHKGAERVTVTDVCAERLQTAASFGADVLLFTDVAAKVEPQDVTIELAGAAAAVELAVSALDVGGIAVMGGAVRPSRPLSLDPEALIRRRLILVGVHNYEPRHLQHAVDFLARTELPWGKVIADPVPLERGPMLLTEGPGQMLRSTIDCRS